jgi:hypothetical protein
MPESTTTDPVPFQIHSGITYLVSVDGGDVDIHSLITGAPVLEGTVADGERFELCLPADDSPISMTWTASASSGVFFYLAPKK